MVSMSSRYAAISVAIAALTHGVGAFSPSSAALALRVSAPAQAAASAPQGLRSSVRHQRTARLTTLNMGVQFNFAGATGRDGELVYGSERPGAADELNKAGAITPEMVTEWGKFMKEKGIERVLCLLNEEELGFYAEPGYVKGLVAVGFDESKITCANMFSDGAADLTGKALKEAKDKNEKLVLHCSGGEGRTGVVLGQWLALDMGIEAGEACDKVLAYAGEAGAVRKPVPAKLEKFLSQKSLK